MEKVIIAILILLYSIVGYSQSEVPVNCKFQINKFQKDSSSGSILYPKLDLTILFVVVDNEIDSIIQIVYDNDTLDRFKDGQIKDFEETFPILEIVDFGVFLRMNEMLDYDLRKIQYSKLERSYAEIKSHLFGVFSEGFAIVKCNKGYNFVNKNGNLLFECFFENATNFVDGKAKVKYSGIWLKIDLQGGFYTL
jgi:hypothetical protein